MAEVAITFGASMITAILQPMAERAGKELYGYLDKMVNIKTEIDNLQKTVLLIADVIQDAEEKQIEKKYMYIRAWLRQLVDVGYEARDVLDDFFTYLSYKRAKKASKLERDKKASKSVKSKLLFCFFKSGSSSSTIPFKKKSRLATDIKSINKKLDELTRQGNIFSNLRSVVGGSSGSETVTSRQRPETGPFQDKQRDVFVGRDAVKEDILRKVLNHSHNSVDIIPIWGMGGIGKTTLAQSIFNDPRVTKGDMYPSKNRVWHCVGEKKLDAKEIIKGFVDGLNPTSSTAEIQKKLVEKFNGDKFLIVLDDVWDVDKSEWELLWNPLTYVGKGGVIIITTRDKNCITTVTESPVPDPIAPLSYDNCWLIFKSHAYNNIDQDNDMDKEKLEIGQEIVRKLKGLPLAAKVVGSSLLRAPDVRTWRKFLESPLRKLNNKEDDVMPVLRWSYNRLPSHLKQCFSYCALFPKDHEFDQTILVKMWMAHDIIPKEAQGGEEPEDIGNEYFKELVNTSFFQQTINGKYVMHDMIHDLALLVSGEDFITFSKNSSPDQTMDKVIRHVTIRIEDGVNLNSLLCKTKGILTLYTHFGTHFNYDLRMDDLVKQFKSIRVLVLDYYGIRKIPDCIKELKHLRYLDLSRTRLPLPDSVCELYNLQTLAAHERFGLPKGVVNMKNLRHLRGTLDTCKGLGKLTSLQELSKIRVRKGDSLSELGGLLKLRGKLKIEGLGTFMPSDDADVSEALKIPPHLESLYIDRYNGDMFPNVTDYSNKCLSSLTIRNCYKVEFLELDASEFPPNLKISKDVLETLKIPPNLKSLQICGYNGDTFPSWFTNSADYSNKCLSSLTIFDCDQVEFLELDAFLSIKHLDIARCSNLKSIRLSKDGASTIEVLKIIDCDKFTKMDIQSLPVIREFHLQNCNVIAELHVKLEIEGREDDFSLEDAAQDNMRKKIHIEDLSLRPSSDYGNFEKSTMIEDVLEAFNCPSNLKYLQIHDYNGDTFPCWFTNSADYSYKCLSSLMIFDCDQVEFLELDAFPSIKHLDIARCSNLKSIRLSKDGASTIEVLKIRYCDKFTQMDIQSLPALREFYLEKCNVIRYLRVKLEIEGREDDFSLEDAAQDNMRKKIHIEDLSLHPSSDYGNFEKSTMIEDVLEAFNCPPQNLKSLGIYGYNGDTFPCWFTNAADYLKRCLSSLDIENCDKVELLQLDAFVSLKGLYVKYCSNLQRIRLAKEVAATIEDLWIYNCRELREMEIESLPSLSELWISECDKLISFPPCLVKIERMTVVKCAELSSLTFTFEGIKSLTCLNVNNCPMLKQFSIVEEGSTSSSSSTSPSTTVLSLPPDKHINLFTHKFESDAQGRLVLKLKVRQQP